MGKRRLVATTFALALVFFCSPARAFECEEKPMVYTGNEFFFDQPRFYLGQKDSNPVMNRLESHEGYVKLPTLDATSIFTAPTELVAEIFDIPTLCNWWPRNLAMPWSIAYQAFFGRLTVGGDYGASINVHNYNAIVGFRWYVAGETLGTPESIAFFGLEGTHWSWHPGEDIGEGDDALSVEEYAKRNHLDTSRVFVTDAFSFQWAHAFKLNPRVPVAYQLGYNMFQAALGDFFRSDLHRHYPYQWFFEGQIAYEPTSHLSFPMTVQFEANDTEIPRTLEIAMETRSSGHTSGGFKLFSRWSGGINDNTFVSWHWGLVSRSPMVGFGWSWAH